MNLKPKIVFMGTPEFGAVILEGLVKGGYRQVLVITSPDKPAGREKIITPPPIKVIAQKYNIPILQPEILTDSKSQIINYKPDLIIVAAFGQILPKEILKIPKYGCLNIHPSLLPRWRGASPIQYAILNGDKETGISIILMTEKLDEGEIIASSEFQITNSKITYPELSKELANLGTKLLLETIPKWLKNEVKPKSQNNSEATYTKALTKEDGKIDWKKPAKYIERKIRAFFPWPGSFCFWDRKQIKILKANVLKETKKCPFGLPGKTFLAPDDKIAVQTGKDFLLIEKLQLEGRKPMSSKEFLRGQLKFIGNTLK